MVIIDKRLLSEIVDLEELIAEGEWPPHCLGDYDCPDPASCGFQAYCYEGASFLPL